MPALLLDAGCSIACPHGGHVDLTSVRARVNLSGKAAVLATGPLAVTGCSHRDQNGVLSPCTRIFWRAATTRLKTEGAGIRLVTGHAICVNARGRIQGRPTVTSAQGRVKGL